VLIYLSDVEEVREPNRYRLPTTIPYWRRQGAGTTCAAPSQLLARFCTQGTCTHANPSLSLIHAASVLLVVCSGRFNRFSDA
jgi:hypothetical protein